MKKFLSLVLALVMTMSLVTISAGAEDFTDADDITYVEAVEVMDAIGVVTGDTAGNFNPTNGLTRGAAAKIICNLILGPTTAAALSADVAPYKDVAVDNVFAGYIAYCQSEGIISGYADGTFKPAAPLTGYAFMKMLLGALGYDAAIEGYVGANWSINVAKRALGIGLDDGLVDDFNGSKALTREEAMLYAFNTLTATMVEYENNSTITVGDIVIQNNTKATNVISSIDAAANFNANEANADGYTLQFAEKSFPRLTADYDVRDDFGRPATTWYVKNVKVGSYSWTPDATFVGSVTVHDIYTALGLGRRADATDYYFNGGKTTPGSVGDPNLSYDPTTLTAYNISKSNTNKLKDMPIAKTGNGTIVEVFTYATDLGDADSVANETQVDVCVISVYPGQIQKVVPATSTKDAYVVVENLKGNILGFTTNGNNEITTDLFAEDEIVAFTYSETATAIETMYAMESVEGTLSERVMGQTVKLGDTTYDYGKEYTFESGLTEPALNNDSTYKAYLDENGKVLYVTETEFVAGNYALVDDIQNVGGWIGNRAKLVMTDGSYVIADLDKNYMDPLNGGIAQDDIVLFAKKADGTYKLKLVTNAVPRYTDADFTMAKGTAAVTFAGGAQKFADSKTVIVVKDCTGSWKAYTGIKNAPSIADDATDQTEVAYYCKSGDVLSVLFVHTNTANLVTQNSKDVVFVAGNSVKGRFVDKDDNEYYTYNAVVNGEMTTVKIAAASDNGHVALLNHGHKVNKIFNGTTISDGIITDATYYAGLGTPNVVTAGEYGFGVKKLSGEYTIGIYTADDDDPTTEPTGLVRWTVAKDANIYYVDADGVISKSDLGSIFTDWNDKVNFTVDDGEITNLFVQYVKD